jgi:hypothetical protein
MFTDEEDVVEPGVVEEECLELECTEISVVLWPLGDEVVEVSE